MTSIRWALQCSVLLIASGCSTDRAQTIADPARSESAPLALPADPSTLAAQLAVPVDSLRAAGEERYSREAYDSAKAIWRVELLRARSSRDSLAEARVLMWLGLAAWRLGDYAAARREGEAAVSLKRRLGLDVELSRSFNGLGLVAWNEGRHRDALVLFDSALASAHRHDDGAGVARAAANIPLVKVELGDFDGARKGFEQALHLGKLIEDDRTQGNALANLAMLEIRLGDPAKALPLLAQARKHYAAIDYTTGESNALGQLATALSGMGDIQRALVVVDSALAIARAQGLQQEVAADLEVIADLHVQAGNPRLALRRLHEADSLDALLGLAVERGTNLRRSSGILLDMGENQSAVDRARDALRVHRGVEAKAEAVSDRLQLALSLASRIPEAARSQADSASHEAWQLHNQSLVREAAVVSARLALDAHDAKSALEHLRNAGRSNAAVDWRIADLRAEALLAAHDISAARREAERAVAALERERASLGSGPVGSGFFANRVAPFSRLVAIHLARGDTASAFQVAATLPGRGLAERLGRLSEAPASVATVTQGERLLLRASELEREIAETEGKPNAASRRAALSRSLEATRGLYEEQLTRQAPSPQSRLLGLTTVMLADIQARLGTDEALISYLSGPDRLDMFIVRRSSVLHRSIPIGSAALAARVRAARSILGGQAQSAVVAAMMGELHDMLIPQSVIGTALSGANHFFVVPHGALGALPFAALWNRRTGRFLVQDRTLSYLPSVAALMVPVRDDNRSMSRFEVFAPLPDSLPGAAREGRAVAGLVGRSDLRLGSGSTETAMRAALSSGASIHLASHGTHNSQNPLFSRLIVGRSSNASARNDGRLEVHEVLGLRTTSPLVFLSGCETGLGSAGDGPFANVSEEGSLAQAFLFAGAETVVATLWRVGDADAVRIAESFYRNRRAGMRPQEALAAAQRAAIREGRALTWAAYTVSGGATRKSAGAVRKMITEP
ncbi:MAG: CHAT domain-containing protein [Gemmatimonadales bacterium]